MNTIKILPEHIANKIAAGEVIERPASIVKELVENALDAGAKQIEIAVNYSGKSLIRVADDGRGMSAQDAELAFQRYATSKIASVEDLTHISSYGFRGEALPSIAAVSRVKLITRTPDDPTATELIIEGGKLQSVKEAAGKPGSVIEVRDLFFNTPARRKFIKGDTTETGHIYETVCNLALSRPHVRFVYKEGEKIELDLLPSQKIRERAAAVLGENVAPYLLDVETQASGIRIYGVIGKPHAARANRSGQLFFINRRWVRSFSLSYALQAGYHGLLMHGQHPIAVLFLDLDLSRVDVNVHPTKQEVRISNEAEIKSLLREAVSQALSSAPDLAPPLKAPDISRPLFSEPPVRTGNLPSFLYPSYKQEEDRMGVSEPPASFPAVKIEPALVEAISLRDKLKITKILGQIHHTFIVAETDEGLMLIDQHAAHERVMFEVLVKNFNQATPISQRLLMEEVLECHPKQREILERALPLLRKTGFEIEEFGPNAFVIRAVPAIFEKENAVSVLKTYLEEKEDGKIETHLENQQEEIAALIACKRQSVRAHDVLAGTQLQALLERLAQCDNPFSCPHGRPVLIQYTFSDLEKQFKRKL